MKQISPYAKVKTNRTNLSILLLITHLGFGIACSHSMIITLIANLNTDSTVFPYQSYNRSLKHKFCWQGQIDLIKYKI